MAGFSVSRSPQAPVLEDISKTTRFGLIALATDMTSEGDFRRLLPQDCALHVSRVAYANPTTPENLALMAPKLTEASALIVPDIPLAAICYSCTAASATIGDAKIAQSIHAVRPGVPIVTPTAAARSAFEALGVSRIAILTPYLPEASQSVGDFFENAGLKITQLHGFGLADDREMARITRDAIIAGALAVDGPDNEAIFLSCTGLPAIDTIDEIEKRTGKPVVTSNQASCWAMRRAAGMIGNDPTGFGRLFELPFPGTTVGQPS